MRIVFVCTTNVWGSAMADLMARSLLAEWDPDRQLIQVESLGVRAQVGAPIPAAAQQELAHVGLDASAHRARWMSPQILSGAELVLTMGAIQRDAALALNPRGLRNTFTLIEAARLLASLHVAAPLASGADHHARAVIREMNTARRFCSTSGKSDDLPDIIGDDPAKLRSLIHEVLPLVTAVLHALLLPEFAQDSEGPTRVPTVSSVA